jgi:hypothetical protein
VAKRLGKLGKAIYAGLVAGLGSLLAVVVGNVSLGDVTDGQWLTALLLGLLAGGGVYHLPYRGAQHD